jgi:glycosyltransferase involved in cell wall biosynthesis
MQASGRHDANIRVAHPGCRMISLVHKVVQGLPAGVRRALKSVPGSTLARDVLYKRPMGARPSSGSLRPVVYLPTWLEWDVMKQRPQYILEALARSGHQVWFIDPRVSETMVTPSGVRIVPSLRPVPRSDILVYTHFAPTATLLDRFESPVVIYDILDDLSIYDPDETHLPANRRVMHHHPGLVAAADVVTVSNEVLLSKHLDERPDLLLLENGVDLTLFTPKGQVSDLLPQKPVVGYHGAVSLWFDFDIVEHLARAHPHVSIVIVGPVDERVSERYKQLESIPNVHTFPRQSVDDVVKFVRGFDVGVIPFRVNDMTVGVTPLKMYEYLAMEVPCVATPLPSCVAQESVSTAAEPASFVTHVHSALAMGPVERKELRALAEPASWDSRLHSLLERLDSAGLRTVPPR